MAFDLDDTLAPSKAPIDPRMAGLLTRLLGVVEVSIVSGGSFEQFRTQVLAHLPADPGALSRLHLMPTNGTRYYRFVDGGWLPQYAEAFWLQTGLFTMSAAIGAIEDEVQIVGSRDDQPAPVQEAESRPDYHVSATPAEQVQAGIRIGQHCCQQNHRARPAQQREQVLTR